MKNGKFVNGDDIDFKRKSTQKTCANCKFWNRSKMVTELEYSEAPCKYHYPTTVITFFKDGHTCGMFEELPIRGNSLLPTVIETINKLKRYQKAIDHIDIISEPPKSGCTEKTFIPVPSPYETIGKYTEYRFGLAFGYWWYKIFLRLKMFFKGIKKKDL